MRALFVLRVTLALAVLLAGAGVASCLFPSIDALSICQLKDGMHGPKGVQIVPPSGSRLPAFCIDETEVSVGQYREFLVDNVFPMDPTKFPRQCDWKGAGQDAFTPLGYVWMHYEMLRPAEDNRPVFGVDWCDAAIFCTWAGKRLCGAESPSGGHIAGSSTDAKWASTGEWYRACSGPLGLAYSYGAVPEAGICNDQETTQMLPGGGEGDPFNTTDVTLPPLCYASWLQGPVHDMNGNVQEYEDNCMDSQHGSYAQDLCFARGGPYNFAAADMRCDYPGPN
jgi:formylglycine-generating enzyme required for sulfatase activity